MAKTYKAIQVEEIKTYKCSDGKIFSTKEEAEKHEAEILDPEKAKDLRIKELEDRVLGLEAEIALLNNRIKALESKKPYPWSQPNPDIYPQPWPPYQQPYNPMIPSPKLPAQPGDVVYEDKDHYQRVIMQDDGSLQVTHTAEDDEKAIKDGKTVLYAGHHRVVMDKPSTLSEQK